MGRKLLEVAFAFSGLQYVLMMIASSCCWMLTFLVTTGGLLPMSNIKLGLWSVAAEKKTKLGIDGSMSPNDLQQNLCVLWGDKIAPDLCDAAKANLVLSILLLFMLGIHCMLIGFANWLRYEYMQRMRRQMRRMAVLLECIGAGMISFVLILYAFFIISPLLEVSSGAHAMVVGTSSGIPIDLGYMVLWLIPVFGFASAVMTTMAKFSVEDTVEEVKEALGEMKEVELMHRAQKLISTTLAGQPDQSQGLVQPVGMTPEAMMQAQQMQALMEQQMMAQQQMAQQQQLYQMPTAPGMVDMGQPLMVSYDVPMTGGAVMQPSLPMQSAMLVQPPLQPPLQQPLPTAGYF